MENSEYGDIKDGERVIFRGKVKVNPHSQSVEVVDCYITGGSVVIESTEPLRIPLDKIEHCHLIADIANIYYSKAQLTPGTVTLRYRDASGRSQSAELATSAFDAGQLSNAVKKAQNAPEIAGLRQMWRNAWNRKLAYQTPTATELTKGGKLYADLYAIGLDARMIVRGQLEEQVDGDYGGASLGLIEIQHSPIRLVNVLRKPYHTEYAHGHFYRNVYLVPDSTIFPDSTMFWEGYEIPVHGYGRSVRVKNVPLFGRVIDVRWEGNFEGDLIRRLGQDVSLNQALIKLKEDIEIFSYPEYGCWTISPPSKKDEPATPSREQWDCYEAIARHLLGSSGK